MSQIFKDQIEECLLHIKLQDRTAFSDLYRLSSAKLYGLILKIIPDKELAADVLQISYSKIWLNAASYRSDLGGGWPWVCQLTRNAAIDHVRARKRELNFIDMNAQSRVDHFADSEDNSYSDQSHSRDLNHCLLQVEVQQRQAIIQAYLYGLSHTELASRLKKPLGTIKSWIRRGLKELHQCLEA